ncbi:hypothetical protein DVH05_001242 [Phytophthora capsici]|nr:hypothetical protein DVH05_001241 [Phytophthora capsici]KAG1713455.1 hypothetical protein DVH05_001242 [Phytophthora capsici]
MPTPEEAGAPVRVADPIVPEVDPTDVDVAPITPAASATAAQRQTGRLRRPTNEKPDDDQDDVVEDTRYEYTNVLGSRYFRDDRQAFLVACAPSYVPADNLEPEDLAVALRDLRNLRAETRASGEEPPRDNTSQINGHRGAPAA